MGYWKSKLLPKIQKVFGKDAVKEAAAIEAVKSFDDSKVEVSKEFEEKKTQLQPKFLEIFETSSKEIKTLVKNPKESYLKKHSIKVQKFLDDLAKIDFPGSKAVSEMTSKFGPALVPGPVIYVFEQVSTLIVTEEKTREVEAPAAAAEETTTTDTVTEEHKLGAETAAEVETVAPPKDDPPKEEPLADEPLKS